MAGEKALSNIAQGLVGTFTSRYHGIDGYWGMGVLRALAEGRGVSEVDLNLLVDRPASLDPTAQSEAYARKWFINALTKTKVTLADIVSAEIRVRFLAASEMPSLVLYNRGNPFVCTTTIIARNGVTYFASKVGRCEPHDPSKELQSIRA